MLVALFPVGQSSRAYWQSMQVVAVVEGRSQEAVR